jgi:hypothetical protein
MVCSPSGPGVESAVLRTSILDCINDADGSFNVDKFLQHAQELISQRRWAAETVSDLLSGVDAIDDLLTLDRDLPREIRRHYPRRVWARKATDDGPLELISPQESSWYVMYVSNILISSDARMMEKFRMRFRLPYPSYLELVKAVRSHPIFDRWCGHKKNGKKSACSWRVAILRAWLDIR